MAEELFDTVSDLMPFRAQSFQFPREAGIRILRFLDCTLGRRKFLQGRVPFLPQTVNKRYCLLNALFKMTQSIDFRFVSDSCHFRLPDG